MNRTRMSEALKHPTLAISHIGTTGPTLLDKLSSNISWVDLLKLSCLYVLASS